MPYGLQSLWVRNYRSTQNAGKPHTGERVVGGSIEKEQKGNARCVLLILFTQSYEGILMEILGKRIHDPRFLRLLRELLEAAYLEDWKFHLTLSGTPQGSVLTPPTMLQTLGIFF